MVVDEGTAIRWHEDVLVGFDLETTGVDPLTARIVTAALVFQRPDGAPDERSRSWLVDPGVPIPPAATAVHGITTEQARRHGRPAAQAVAEIVAGITAVVAAGLPLVVFNASYDLTLVAAAARRHGLTAHRDAPRPWRAVRVVDPLVIDRRVDRYRRGKRTLEAMAAHYRIGTFEAHSAAADAIAACLLARRLGAEFDEVGGADLRVLHEYQVGWAAAWAENFQSYLRSSGRADAVIDGTWPVHPSVSV